MYVSPCFHSWLYYLEMSRRRGPCVEHGPCLWSEGISGGVYLGQWRRYRKIPFWRVALGGEWAKLKAGKPIQGYWKGWRKRWYQLKLTWWRGVEKKKHSKAVFLSLWGTVLGSWCVSFAGQKLQAQGFLCRTICSNIPLGFVCCGSAVTNDPKFKASKQHKFIILQFSRSEIWHGSH